MIALIILLIVVLLLIWISFSPIELFIDTRVPIVGIRWRTIGNVFVQYEEDKFWLNGRILFIRWRVHMKNIQSKPKEAIIRKKKKHRPNISKLFLRMWQVVRSFHIRQLEVAFSPENYCLAGQLYPVNYLPIAKLKNVVVSFSGENYVVARIVSTPCRIVYSFIRK